MGIVHAYTLSKNRRTSRLVEPVAWKKGTDSKDPFWGPVGLTSSMLSPFRKAALKPATKHCEPIGSVKSNMV